MKKFARIFSALMALMMLFSISATLSSCNKKENKDPANTPGSVTTTVTEDVLEPLEVKDMDGRVFRMLWPEYLSAEGHFSHNELAVAEGATGDMIEVTAAVMLLAAAAVVTLTQLRKRKMI